MDFFNNLILNSENLKNNIKIIKNIANGKKICAMVKANAYGHGVGFAVLNLKNYVDFFGVANSVEALEVRHYAQKAKILVCGKVQTECIEKMVEQNISFTVFSAKNLFEIISVCKKNNIKANVHIKLNTGMNRLGIKTKSQFLKMLNIIHINQKFVHLEGVYSHLFNSAHDGLSRTQYYRFLDLLNCINIYNQKQIWQNKVGKDNFKHIKNRKCRLLNNYSKNQNQKCSNKNAFDFKSLFIHLENSAGLFNNIDFLNVCNMARVGIALYGLEIKGKGLKPVLELNSCIEQIQKVNFEDYVGYGKTIIDHNGKVAIVPVGYADGIVRAYKDFCVLVGGTYCKILNVCMDSILIDITSAKAKVGDSVCIISSNQKAQNNANQIAKHLGTISYEVLTNLNHKRFNLIIN